MNARTDTPTTKSRRYACIGICVIGLVIFGPLTCLRIQRRWSEAASGKKAFSGTGMNLELTAAPVQHRNHLTVSVKVGNGTDKKFFWDKEVSLFVRWEIAAFDVTGKPLGLIQPSFVEELQDDKPPHVITHQRYLILNPGESHEQSVGLSDKLRITKHETRTHTSTFEGHKYTWGRLVPYEIIAKYVVPDVAASVEIQLTYVILPQDSLPSVLFGNDLQNYWRERRVSNTIRVAFK